MAEYHKYHALGNDYLVIDPVTCDVLLTPDAVRTICDRHRGIGADGVLYGPVPGEREWTLRIYNADGSEAEKSGNGVRIFARYLLEAGYVATERFTIATSGGEVEVHLEAADGSVSTVDMGRLTFWSEEIPVSGPPREVLRERVTVADRELEFSAVSIGNPHCVIILDEVDWRVARTYGPLLEAHPLFPNRTNVQFVRVLDRRNIRIEIWERGSGYTLASGSSSCAAAGVVHRLGSCDHEVTVHMPGGALDVRIANDGRVWLRGPVNSIGRGEFSQEFKRILRLPVGRGDS
ncbi:MAG: diaminopimelate epimerase [Chloroflexi bacterium]|nr:diaminopimelate epimerase [Chloroflexota bacterium]